MIFFPPRKESKFPMNFQDLLASWKSRYCLDLFQKCANEKIHLSRFRYVPRYKSFQESKMRLTAPGHLLPQCVWPQACILADSDTPGFLLGFKVLTDPSWALASVDQVKDWNCMFGSWVLSTGYMVPPLSFWELKWGTNTSSIVVWWC